MLKVVYAGPLAPGGTCEVRYKALKVMAHEVYPFDPMPFFFEKISRWRRAVELRVSFGPRSCRVNFAFLRFCRDIRPDVVWVDKGFWAWPSTLQSLRRQGAFLVHHVTDALSPLRWDLWWQNRLLRGTLKSYDMFFTSNLRDSERFSSSSPPKVELTSLGFDHERFDATPLSPGARNKWESDVIFAGHHEPLTEAGIVSLIDAGIKVKVYGGGWERSRSLRKFAFSSQIRHLEGEEYICALKGAKIGLCFVSEWNFNQTAGRSFEIPACGTFLLAMRTPQHLECYREGEEAEFFGDHQELVGKVRYYLENDALRREIAARGHERCLRSGYSWADRMKRDWEKVKAVLAAAGAISRREDFA